MFESGGYPVRTFFGQGGRLGGVFKHGRPLFW